jgi:hypothetical protein
MLPTVETCKVMLEYPNGRICDCELGDATSLRRGSEFEFYGRHWRVDRLVAPDRWHPDPRWLCIPLGPGPLDRAGIDTLR